MTLLFVYAITCIWVQLKNNCMSNSHVIAWGKAECNFDCYENNYTLITLELFLFELFYAKFYAKKIVKYTVKLQKSKCKYVYIPTLARFSLLVYLIDQAVADHDSQ